MDFDYEFFKRYSPFSAGWGHKNKDRKKAWGDIHIDEEQNVDWANAFKREEKFDDYEVISSTFGPQTPPLPGKPLGYKIKESPISIFGPGKTIKEFLNNKKSQRDAYNSKSLYQQADGSFKEAFDFEAADSVPGNTQDITTHKGLTVYNSTAPFWPNKP